MCENVEKRSKELLTSNEKWRNSRNGNTQSHFDTSQIGQKHTKNNTVYENGRKYFNDK